MLVLPAADDRAGLLPPEGGCVVQRDIKLNTMLVQVCLRVLNFWLELSIQVFQQLMIGLDYCHQKGVVQSDIKLNNMLVQVCLRVLNFWLELSIQVFQQLMIGLDHCHPEGSCAERHKTQQHAGTGMQLILLLLLVCRIASCSQ
jgi:hypothetical protein